MELERNNILKGAEEQWRLRNRAIWMASGDNNTKYFHNFSSHRRTKTRLESYMLKMVEKRDPLRNWWIVTLINKYPQLLEENENDDL